MDVGYRVGRLTVIGIGDDRKHITCKCECGNVCIVLLDNLIREHTRSCGCLKREIIADGAHTTHGWSRTRIYRIWKYMRKRCKNPKDSNYRKYGGRGIKVCEEWDSSFEAFRDWSFDNGYDDTKSIDRIDNNGNYEPGNCRWSSSTLQANNRRSSRLLTIRGETHTIADFSRLSGTPYARIIARLRNGWEPEEAVYTLKGGTGSARHPDQAREERWEDDTTG